MPRDIVELTQSILTRRRKVAMPSVWIVSLQNAPTHPHQFPTHPQQLWPHGLVLRRACGHSRSGKLNAVTLPLLLRTSSHNLPGNVQLIHAAKLPRLISPLRCGSDCRPSPCYRTSSPAVHSAVLPNLWSRTCPAFSEQQF